MLIYTLIEVKCTGLPDVDGSAWYSPYIRYARRAGIIEGYPDGYFRDQYTKCVEKISEVLAASVFENGIAVCPPPPGEGPAFAKATAGK